jgi:ribonuclease BN (tRNA processing enzyme)
MKVHLDKSRPYLIELLNVKIRILGCYGGVTQYHRVTSFLINDSVLLDAGTVSEALDKDELKKIRSILISHAHMDHIRDLPTLADNLLSLGCRGISLAAVKPVLDIVLTHLFNNEIYPDFTRIPSPESPVFVPFPLEVEKAVVLDGLEITPVPVTHTVVCTAFVVKEGGKGFMFTADSGHTKRFWEIAQKEEGIEFILADVSFPSRMEDVAVMSGHMTPNMLRTCLGSYGLLDKTVYITHMKPLFCDEIIEELASTGEKNIKFLVQGGAIMF